MYLCAPQQEDRARRARWEHAADAEERVSYACRAVAVPTMGHQHEQASWANLLACATHHGARCGVQLGRRSGELLDVGGFFDPLHEVALLDAAFALYAAREKNPVQHAMERVRWTILYDERRERRQAGRTL